jgi:lysophospholipase L1-like esterase
MATVPVPAPPTPATGTLADALETLRFGDTTATPRTWLALGDSYTIGEGVAAESRWPMQLAAALRERGRAIADPRILAATGWSTDELAAAMDAAEPLGEYAFTTLLIGVNNQYRGRALGNYREEFGPLLDRAITLARGRPHRTLVLSIPDWGVTPYGQASGRDTALIAAELDAHNAVAAAECATRGVAFVDITPLSRELGARPDMFVEDGLHPSAAMYAEWTRLALPVADRLLELP